MTNPDKPKVRKDEHGWYVTHNGDHLRATSWPLALGIAAVRVGIDYGLLGQLMYSWRRFADGHPVTHVEPGPLLP